MHRDGDVQSTEMSRGGGDDDGGAKNTTYTAIKSETKTEGLASHKQMFLLINSQYVSAQTGHHQVILEKYTNSIKSDTTQF
jgi:hypothetical protein